MRQLSPAKEVNSSTLHSSRTTDENISPAALTSHDAKTKTNTYLHCILKNLTKTYYYMGRYVVPQPILN